MENKTAENLLAKEMGWEAYASGGIMTDTEPIIKVMKEYASLQCAEMKEENERLKVNELNANSQIEQLQEEVERLRSIIDEVQVYPETEEFHERLFLSAKGRELFKALSGKESKTD